MRNASSRIAVLLVIIFTATSLSLFAQQSTPKGTLISLGNVSGAPKNQVMVPLFLTPVPSELAVGKITATIAYARNEVTFLRAEKSFLLDNIPSSLEAKTAKDPSDPSKSLVSVTIETKGKPLHEGLVLTLFFRIAPNAITRTIPLEIQKASATKIGPPPKPVHPLLTKKGSIQIAKPAALPYAGCFFFTH